MAWVLFPYQEGKMDKIALLKDFGLLKVLLTKYEKQANKPSQTCQTVIQQVSEYS